MFNKITGAIWMQRTIFFRPLAVFLALLMMPPEWGIPNLATPAKAATFNLQPGCAFIGGSAIIQQVCGPSSGSPPNSAIIGAVQQWEQDSVAQFLRLYQLPSTPADVAFVYQYARTDLRTAIRGYMQARMMAMALDDPSLLTANETTVLEWFQSRWTYHERNLYTNAINNYNSWVKNPCTWKPDPDIAKVVKLNYIACVGSIVADNAPNANYYLMAGRKSEYEGLLANLPILAPNTVVKPQSNTTTATTPGPSRSGFTAFTVGSDQLAAAIGSATGIAALSLITPAIVFNIPTLKGLVFPSIRTRAVLPRGRATVVEEVEQNSVKVQTDATNAGDTETADEAATLGENAGTELAEEAGLEAETTLEAGADSALETFGIGLVVACVVLLVTEAVTFAVSEADAVQNVGSELQLDQAAAFPGGFVNMQSLLPTSEGLYKYGVVWTEATYPDVPSSSALPTPSATTQFINTPNGQTQPVLGGSSKDWSGNSWTLGYYKGFFINHGSKSVTVNGTTTPITYDTISPTIRFRDWSNNEFMASLVGMNFVVTKRTPTTTDSFCQPTLATGLSSTVNASNCTVQVVNQLQLIDGNGNQATVQIGTAPVFNNPPGQTANNNGNTAMLTMATGIPTPALSWMPGLIEFNGSLENAPAGLAFLPLGPGSGEVDCCQAPVAPGTYQLPVTATNIVGSASGFTFTVADPSNPLSISQISGPSGCNIVPMCSFFGQNQTWIWQASGAGPYHFYTDLTIPGLTFTDNGSGTAQFSGTPTGAFTTQCTSLNFCGVWVTNTTTQSFVPDANHAFLQFVPNFLAAPSATLTLPGVSFPQGKTTSYVLTSQGAVTPVSYLTPCSGLPDWFTVTDNRNNTATVTGSPGLGDATSLPFVIQAAALGSQLPHNPCATPNFVARVDSTLTVLSPSSATFQAQTNGTFTIQSNGNTVVIDSPLPSGLLLVTIPNDTGQALITGVPAVGTGGEYHIQYHVTPTIDQGAANYNTALFLTINEKPGFNLPTNVYMMAKVPQNFVVQPTGYPTLGDMTVSLLSGSASVPPGFSGSGDSEITTSAGTYTLAGTIPASAAGNTYQLQFGATNSIGSATGGTTITVVPPGDVNHDMVTNCTDYDIVKSLLNVTSTSPKYNPAADINSDGVINILDLAFISAQLPKGTVCQ